MERKLTSVSDFEDHNTDQSEAITGNAGSTKRKRQPRNSACQACAVLKMKCAPTASGRCERCIRTGRECRRVDWSHSRRRSHGGVSRFQKPRQSIPLSDLLQPGPALTEPRIATEISSKTQRETSKQEHRSNTPQNGPRSRVGSFASEFAQNLGGFATCEELLEGIEHAFVTHCFSIFHNLSRHFPFIDIPVAVDISSMITHRPLLTVAVCVSTSSARPEAQSRLLRAFRHAVSSKIFLTSEKSLDILLGLLVHIAWSHHSLSHVQLYQHLHLIAAMAADQGLYVPTSSADETPNALERNRALIGSYYLCAHLPEFGLERPNPMRWNDNLFQCARSVARMGHLPSD
ncbi:uncharacterized protein K489DRAFT_312274, partial [Dissoconium aciculare CBS 342.82]|uniref:Zn(2)-C6 fungal-type domain-containing protein n=1 Tax=Dissoconium aciculare CBS 342.82 TaxID=1314786 RepID=A0A6J3MD67_9PEZI